MTAASFKFKYAATAFLVVLIAATAVVARCFLCRHEADTRTLGNLAEQAAHERVTPELQARAQSLAAHAADAIAGAVRAGDASGMERRLQPFIDNPTVAALGVTTSTGPGAVPLAARMPRAGRARSPPRRARRCARCVENIPGAVTPATLATLTRDARAGRTGRRREPRRQPDGSERRAHAPTWLFALGARRPRRAARRRLAWRAMSHLQRPVERPHQERRAHRPGRLHPPGGRAPRRCARASCSRRSSACAGGCASRPSTRATCTACSTA